MQLLLIALFSYAFSAIGHFEWAFEKVGPNVKATILVYDHLSSPLGWDELADYVVTNCDEGIVWTEGSPTTSLYHEFTHQEIIDTCAFTHDGGLIYSKLFLVQADEPESRRAVYDAEQYFNLKFRIENSTSVYYDSIIYSDITPDDTDTITLEIEVLRIDAIDGDEVPDTPPWIMRKSTTFDSDVSDSIVYFRVQEPEGGERRGIEVHEDITEWLSDATADTKVELRTAETEDGLALDLIGATLADGCTGLRRGIEANVGCMEGSFYIPGVDIIPFGGEYKYIYFEFTVIHTEPSKRRKLTITTPLTSGKNRRQIVDSPFASYNAIILGPDGGCTSCGTLTDLMWAVLIIGIISLVILGLGLLLMGYFLYKQYKGMAKPENYKPVELEE